MTEEVEVQELPESETVEQKEPPAKAWSDADEEEARFFGWKPDSEWQGERPAGYIGNPNEWMDRVKRSKTFTAMETRLRQAEQAAADHARRMAAVYDRTAKQQQEQYEQRIADLNARQRAAVETADTAEYDRLQVERQKIVAPQPIEAAPDPEQLRPVREYVAAHDWTKNPLLWREASEAINMALSAGQHFGSPKDQIDYVDGLMRQKYPHLFQAPQPASPPRPARPAPVDGGGLGGNNGGDPFAKLPADARAAFANMVKRGDFKDDAAGRKQFVEFYNES